jgi:hypothetical protein
LQLTPDAHAADHYGEVHFQVPECIYAYQPQVLGQAVPAIKDYLN